MEEKIKISLAKETLELLRKDCEDFKITKQNGQINFNSFINLLIYNYFESFTAKEETLYDNIRDAISIIPNYYQEKVFGNIAKLFAKQSYFVADKHSTTTFSFKPTKISEKAITYINQMVIKDESISSFYRRMFTAYSQLTKTEREKIIHKENYEILKKAIRKGVQVYIVLNSKDILHSSSIFAISPAKDELFNYVLVYYGKQNYTLRLASIYSISLLSENSSIPEENRSLFERQIACAAQYPMYNTDNEPIIVQLTEKGKKLFNKIYLYRPTPVSIEGDIYTFNCSANQLLYYFERFGDSALILSPKKLGVFMRNYYYFALKKYKSKYKSD
ncbi:MAG: hypothetical protein HFE25_07995 [Clostridia bacterium]|jgi:hypothetical protein|nr:hypothetical protein [Clostridia bacterium]